MTSRHWQWIGVVAVVFLGRVAWGQEAHHHDHAAAEPPPKIFWDKSPRIIAYQLNRLSNERLLRVERSVDDAKYRPIFAAILTRPGISTQDRQEALRAIVVIQHSHAVAELLAALAGLDTTKREEQQVAGQLAALLLALPAEDLAAQASALEQAARGDAKLARPAALAGLLAADQSDRVWSLAAGNDDVHAAAVEAVALLPKAESRGAQRERVLAALDGGLSIAVRRAAVRTLGSLTEGQDELARRLAPLVAEPTLRNEAVRTLLRFEDRAIPGDVAVGIVRPLVAFTEATPAARRTSADVIDVLQLVERLMARLPDDQRRALRERLRAVTVRLVVIQTINEEMRYDRPYFAVEAGRPVQVVLRNEDLMPHNLVVTAPGALREVAEAGALLPQGTGGKEYVPDSPRVLFATAMVPAGQAATLTFTAPTEPGEYPYVCTFPRHWMRMYGVMVVTPDLDEWLKSPTAPADPTGNNRSFVKSWTTDELAATLPDGLRGRSPEIGEQIFREATCAQCHKLRGEGGAVGPDLTDVVPRWKGDLTAILREILDPSHKVDPKYAVHVVTTKDGQVYSGIIQAESVDRFELVVNPESPQPIAIARGEIDEMVRSPVSMMPKALLDRFTQDEILELVQYLVGYRSPD